MSKWFNLLVKMVLPACKMVKSAFQFFFNLHVKRFNRQVKMVVPACTT